MDRKPVWINGREVYMLPWAMAWDVLLAAPREDFHDVWSGRAFLLDERGNAISPEEPVRPGQKLFVKRIDRKAS